MGRGVYTTRQLRVMRFIIGTTSPVSATEVISGTEESFLYIQRLLKLFESEGWIVRSTHVMKNMQLTLTDKGRQDLSQLCGPLVYDRNVLPKQFYY